MGDDRESFSSFTTRRIIYCVGDELIYGKGFSSDGGLVRGHDRVPFVTLVLLFLLAIIRLLTGRTVTLGLQFRKVFSIAISVPIVANEPRISRDDLTILNNNLFDR